MNQPETGAVDVDEIIRRIIALPLVASGQVRNCLKPLTARISKLEAECKAWEESTRDTHIRIVELEKENELLLNRQHDDAGVIEAYIASEGDLKKRIRELELLVK